VLLLHQPDANTYIPFLHECFEVHKALRHILVLQVGFILLQQPAACLAIIGLGDGVLEIRLLDCIEGDDYAVQLCERLV
jgi:hypothetical protein